MHLSFSFNAPSEVGKSGIIVTSGHHWDEGTKENKPTTLKTNDKFGWVPIHRYVGLLDTKVTPQDYHQPCKNKVLSPQGSRFVLFKTCGHMQPVAMD